MKRPDPPIGARVIAWALEGIDEEPLAQTTDLVVDDVYNPNGVLGPVMGGGGVRRDLLPPITDKHGLVALEGGLEAQVVIDPAIAQYHLLGIGRRVEIRTLGCLHGLCDLEHHW